MGVKYYVQYIHGCLLSQVVTITVHKLTVRLGSKGDMAGLFTVNRLREGFVSCASPFMNNVLVLVFAGA